MLVASLCSLHLSVDPLFASPVFVASIARPPCCIMSKEKVQTKHYGRVDRVDKDWPSGGDILKLVTEHTGKSNAQSDPCSRGLSRDSPDYWQTCVRWALLQKFGSTSMADRMIGKAPPDFTLDDRATMQTFWDQLVHMQDDSAVAHGTSDLFDFIKHGTSNNRQLQWSVMKCEPACQFNLHAHPNIEIIYCISGALHEIRMQGAPIARDFESASSDKDNSNKLKGPSLTTCDRPWFFATVNEGEWLVNEVGSIHKSFTATSGTGCTLLVLWGGSHADIDEGDQPRALSIDGAVDDMDSQLGRCNCRDWNTISQTFLPDSEKMAA
jgi:hypothetical protein